LSLCKNAEKSKHFLPVLFFCYHQKKVGKETCLPVYLPKAWQAGVTAA
jgi:hypothetical protein